MPYFKEASTSKPGQKSVTALNNSFGTLFIAVKQGVKEKTYLVGVEAFFKESSDLLQLGATTQTNAVRQLISFGYLKKEKK